MCSEIKMAYGVDVGICSAAFDAIAKRDHEWPCGIVGGPGLHGRTDLCPWCDGLHEILAVANAGGCYAEGVTL